MNGALTKGDGYEWSRASNDEVAADDQVPILQESLLAVRFRLYSPQFTRERWRNRSNDRTCTSQTISKSVAAAAGLFPDLATVTRGKGDINLLGLVNSLLP